MPTGFKATLFFNSLFLSEQQQVAFLYRPSKKEQCIVFPLLTEAAVSQYYADSMNGSGTQTRSVVLISSSIANTE